VYGTVLVCVGVGVDIVVWVWVCVSVYVSIGLELNLNCIRWAGTVYLRSLNTEYLGTKCPRKMMHDY